MSNSSFITTPADNSLKQRAQKKGGISREEALKRAEKAIQDLDINYPEIASPKLAIILEYVSELTHSGALSTEKHEKLYRECHDIKGQGGSFGYPLISEVAASLCVCLEFADKENLHYISAINNHVAAMKLLIDRNVKGRGGLAEQELVKTIHEVSTKLRTDAEEDQ